MTTGVKRDADMKAVTWQGHREVSVEEVADPIIKEQRRDHRSHEHQHLRY